MFLFLWPVRFYPPNVLNSMKQGPAFKTTRAHKKHKWVNMPASRWMRFRKPGRKFTAHGGIGLQLRNCGSKGLGLYSLKEYREGTRVCFFRGQILKKKPVVEYNDYIQMAKNKVCCFSRLFFGIIRRSSTAVAALFFNTMFYITVTARTTSILPAS